MRFGLPYAATWTVIPGADYTWFLPGNMRLKQSVRLTLETPRFQQVDLNPLPAARNSTTKLLDASLIRSGELNSGTRNHPWTQGVVVRNLTNEKVLQFSSGSTLAGVGRTLFGTLEELRVVAVKGSIAW